MPIKDQKILVIGGTSGLGLGLSMSLSSFNKVIVTGRTDPKEKGLEFRHLELCDGDLSKNLDSLIGELPAIDVVVYAAGHYERGALAEMNDEQIVKMHNLYLLAPTLLLARMLRKQQRLSGFIAISSISQLKPKANEVIYCSAKAGFGMLSNCLSLDQGIDKVLVVAPARINKDGNVGAREGNSGKLDAAWVVDTILKEYEGDFQYKLLSITRDPAKIDIKEMRKKSAEA